MKKRWMLVALPFLFAGAAAYAGGDVDAGKSAFEASCADCHYEDDFAGETEADIAGLIKGVMAGEVEHKSDLSGLSDTDVANLAAYFASFQ